MQVIPGTWKSSKKSMKQDWILYYRYYNPLIRNDKGKIKAKLVRIKRMNSFTDWDTRIAATEELMEVELSMLHAGYDPWKREIRQINDISVATPLSQALQFALEKMEVVERVRDEARNILKYVQEALILLRIDIIPVSEVEASHMAALMVYLRENMPHIIEILQARGTKIKASEMFTPAKYNRYRANLQMLFKVLKKRFHVIKTNPIEDVEKMKKVRKLRQVLTQEERNKVKDHLYTYHRDLWRFMHIFHQSGSRETELLLVKGRDVNLLNQTFKRTVSKRKEGPTEVETAITNSSLPFWKEALENCLPNQYMFSKNLKPGDRPINPNQINKYWRKYVKIPLGIEADIYSLKHSFTTELRAILTAKEVAEHNAHQNTEMVETVYDVEALSREQKKIKSVNISF
jgi:integrase